MARPFTTDDGRTGIEFLLSFTFAGFVWRFATSPVSITDKSGAMVPHQGSLDLGSVKLDVPLFTDSPSDPSISVTVQTPGVNVADLVARGHYLQRARAEIAGWIPGTVYEDRRVFASGYITEPEYGGLGEPLSFTIRGFLDEDRGTFPPPEAVCTEQTWPNRAPLIDGEPYPFVFGAPGRYSFLAVTGNVPATRGLLVNTGSTPTPGLAVLIADGVVGATSVTLTEIKADGTKQEASKTVNTGSDGAGRTISYVTVAAAGTGGPTTPAANPDSEFWVRWGGTAGGVQEGGTAVRSAADVAEIVLRSSTVGIDVPRWRSVGRRLAHIALDGVIEQQVTPMEWVRDQIVPLMPMGLGVGPNGVYPAVWDPDAKPEWHLVEGQNFTRVGRMVEVRQRQYNDHTIRYALGRYPERRWYGSIRFTGRDPNAEDSSASDAFRKQSEQAFGSLRAPDFESETVWSGSTAWEWGRWKSRAESFPWVQIYGECPPSMLRMVEGTMGEFTESATSMSSRKAYLQSLEIARSVIRVVLVVQLIPANLR